MLSKGNRAFDPHSTAHAKTLAGRPLATFRQRAVAILIDFALIALIWIPAKMGMQYLIQQRLHIREEVYRSASGHVTARFDLERTIDLAWTVVLLAYFGVFVRVTNGYTPGKRLMRIRVVSLEHARISRWQSMERALGYGASALEGGFGFIQYFLYRNHTCTHDRIAETIVVREPKEKKGLPAKPHNPPTRQDR
jgi:uncharacterized RDD family membrane protein YckC